MRSVLVRLPSSLFRSASWAVAGCPQGFVRTIKNATGKEFVPLALVGGIIESCALVLRSRLEF